MSLDVKITGVIEVEKMLDKQYKAKLPKIVTQLANFMQNRAISNLNKNIYERSVWWKRSGGARQGMQVTDVGSGKKVASTKEYTKFLETGTKPHAITSNKAMIIPAKNLNGYPTWAKSRVMKDGSIFLGRKVKHPGFKARPFFKPAVEDTRKEAKRIITYEL